MSEVSGAEVSASTEMAIESPPSVRRQATGGGAVRLIPLVTLLSSLGLVVVIFVSGAPVSHNPLSVLFPLTMVGSSLAGVLAGSPGRRSAGELNSDRESYLAYLGDMAARFADTAQAQRDRLNHVHPEQRELWALVASSRRWERRRKDPAFGRVRIGTGAVRAETRPVARARPDGVESDPVTASALDRFLTAHAHVDRAPVTVCLDESPWFVLDGDHTAARDLLRAMICELAVLHSPDDVMVAAVVDTATRPHWDWLKWLPHNGHPETRDDLAPLRMVYPTLAEAVASRPAGRWSVVIVDAAQSCDVAGEAPVDRQVTVLQLGSSEVVTARTVRLTPGQVTVAGADGSEKTARPDALSPVDALVCARRLAACAELPHADRGRPASWLDEVGVLDPVSPDVDHMWRTTGVAPLPVPIGTDERGEQIELDISEAAHGGMGPHGLCLGATGSGKSELLRSIALGMICRHSPDDINLILIDFKGGATFLGFDRAHHVAAVITNLAEEAYLVDRMRDALNGELTRRQRILRAAGNLTDIAQYRARSAGGALPALPTLVVIVDEFTELLAQQPDFIDVFVAIGRLGRSLGIHLLLASQRLDEGRLRGLDSHLSYRICLKTLSVNESRAAIGIPDAYQLPTAPGAAYLKVGAAEPVRFQGAFVSGRAESGAVAIRPTAAVAGVEVFSTLPHGKLVVAESPVEHTTASSTVLDLLLDGVGGRGRAAHQVWLPPLRRSPTLAEVIADHRAETLVVPIGLVDRVFEQRRCPLAIDLSGPAGNVAIVGAPQSGKTTAVRTLVAALATTHDPVQVQVYLLDLGGGLVSLSALPHVGVVVGRADRELVHRTVDHVTSVLRDREALFRELGVDSMSRYRDLRPDGDNYGDVFLVIDGWAVLRQEFTELEAAVAALAAQGLSYGVHVILTASRWADVRPALRDQIGTRIELRLGDPADSEIDRARARHVPANRPGHGLSADGMPVVIAIPGGAGSSCKLAGAIRAPGVRLLPALVDYRELLDTENSAPGPGLVLGIEEHRLTTVAVDFAVSQHAVILGDGQCGKTATLRLLCHELSRTTTVTEAQIFVMDPRRTMAGVVRTQHLAGYVSSSAALATRLPELTTLLEQRVPGECDDFGVAGTSWRGPEIYLVIDDHDLLARVGGTTLAKITELIPYSRDIGLHIVLARRGGSRALYDPTVAALRDAGAMVLQMSAGGDDPMPGNGRPRRLPPGRAAVSDRTGDERLIQVAWSEPVEHR